MRLLWQIDFGSKAKIKAILNQKSNNSSKYIQISCFSDVKFKLETNMGLDTQ